MNTRIEIISKEIELLEKSFNGTPIKINTTELMKKISGLEDIKQPYLILAGKVFRRRGNWVHKQEFKSGKRYWEYIGKENIAGIWS